MPRIDSIPALEKLYGLPAQASLRKVARRMTPQYRRWILKSRFCALTTVGPDGTDCTPRGDDGPVVTEIDPGTLAMADWHGNNRIDSLRNIVVDGRVSLMFLVAGSTSVVRVNGRAIVTDDPELIGRFARGGKQPRSVIVIDISEIYIQCARAVMRAGLWSMGDQSEGLPTAGDILKAMTMGELGGQEYDQLWPKRAAETMW